ncbi:MAG: hypothetical protein ACLFPX_01810 [Candidatus Omnitrophota bacterium]
MPETPIDFNLAESSSALKIPPAIYKRILEKAIKQTEEDLFHLKEAGRTQDEEVIGRISHRLKGDFANLRIPQLSDKFRVINFMIKQDEYDPSVFQKNIQEISDLLEQLKLCLH